MMKRTTLLFIIMLASFASFAQIIGVDSLCTGSTTTLADSASGGGTWSSSNPSIATVASSSPFMAIINGVSAGTATISYVFSTGVHTSVVSVNPTPTAIVGAGVTICSGTTLTLSSTPSGGNWSVSGPATIGVTSGVLTAGSTSGTVNIMYDLHGCSVSDIVIVNSTSPDSIVGASSVCLGSTTTLGSSVLGGTWSSSNPAVATVSSGGIVTGVSGGIAIITHVTSGPCGSSTATHTITVTSTGSAGTISGPATISIGGTGALSPTVSGGAWSSSLPSVATISPTGVVTGVAAGTAVISYAVSGCGPTVYATYTVTVTTPNGISGYVHYSGWNSAKVWLIKYNPSTSMLTAVDSTYTYGLDSAYYEFLGLPTDSYRVKAAIDSGSYMGLMPTYHTSSFYWNTATVIHHTSGMWDAHKDINILTGTSTPGSGFIGGSVLTGANKGTADGAPAVGLGVYLVNSSTSAVVKYTETDASGNYSFSGLAYGTYYVFPEALGYMTTPYTGITLSASAASMSTAKFTQRTISKKITPITAAVNDVTANTSIVAFPNPTSGKLNISWDAATSEAATLVISDVTGREVLAKDFSMTKGAGAQVVDLSSFAKGMYFVSVKSANTMFISKIEVRH